MQPERPIRYESTHPRHKPAARHVPTAEVGRVQPGSAVEQPDAPIVLAFGADESFAMPLAVALYSALSNLSRGCRAHVFILDGGMSTSSRRRLQGVAARAHPNVRLEFIVPGPEQLSAYELWTEDRFSAAVFLRLLIPALLPDSYAKAIYLDSDVIVERDLTHLWREDLGGNALLAVQERNVASPYGMHNWRELGLPHDAPYLNSGVLVINLRQWREDHIAWDVFRYLDEHRADLNLPHEQEGLNAVLAGRWGMLDMPWNVTYPFYDAARFDNLPFADELREVRTNIARDPYIVHFNIASKPWHADCTHPARRRFYRYLKKSRWFGPDEYFRWRARLAPGQAIAHVSTMVKKALRKSRRALASPTSARRHDETTSASDRVVLVFTADEAFAMPLAVTLYSALVNLQTEARPLVYVLDGGFSAASRRRILTVASRAHRRAEVVFVKPEPSRLSAYSLKMEGRFSRAIFLRLLIPELLPADIEKAIYLDSDMVVEGDLSQLWRAELDDHALLAVQDLAIPHVSSTPRGLYNWRELGLSPSTPYFNSGLLVLNLRRWRDDGIADDVLDYLSRHRDHLNMHGNQEGFNAVLTGRWGALDPRWNVIHHAYDRLLFERVGGKPVVGRSRTELTREPCVIHFTARRKPWQASCVHPERRRFFHYLKESGWFRSSVYVRWRLRLLPYQAASSLRYVLKTRSRVWRRALMEALRPLAGPHSSHQRT